MTASLCIRPYQPADLDAVVALWYRSWHASLPGLHHPHPIEAWRRRFRDEISQQEVVWVAERNGRLVGFLALYEAQGYLDQLYVEPDLRGQGIGTALLIQARCLCPGGLTLHALQANTSARAFYVRHGFVEGPPGVNRVNGQPNVEYRWTPA